MSNIFSLNPIATEQEAEAKKVLQCQALEEIKTAMQESRFHNDNSIWRGGEYNNSSYGYGVENFGEWDLDTNSDGEQEEFLGAGEACFIDDLTTQFNLQYPTLDCGWQEDSAKMITVYVGLKRI